MRTVVHTAHQARAMLAVALLACGLTMAVVSFFDPFGREASRADFAARRATGVVLCIQEAAFRARLHGITAIERTGDPLSASDENLKAVLIAGLDEMGVARGSLGVTCSNR